MNRDSTIFYRSFFEAIKELPEANQLELYNAIFEHSLNNVRPNLLGLSKTIYTLIEPQVLANLKRYENGSKPKVKQEESKTEAKKKQPKSESKANKNKNKNKNDNKNILLEDVINYFTTNGYSKESAMKFFNYYSVSGWKDGNGKEVKVWKQKAQSVWFKDENKIKQQDIFVKSIADQMEEMRNG
jgi:hypothetical protein